MRAGGSNFKIKTLNSARLFILIDWQKLNSGGPASWSSILLLITTVREYGCTQKMLKNIKTDKTIGFFVTFLPLVAFQLEVARASYPPSGCAYVPWRRA